MPDANTAPKQHPAPANVEVAAPKARGGAGLFSLYRSLGSASVATATSDKPAAMAEGSVTQSRAARLLAAQAPASAPVAHKAEAAFAPVPKPAAQTAELPQAKEPSTAAKPDESAAVSADELIDGPETKALKPETAAGFPDRRNEASRATETLARAMEEVFTDFKPLAPVSPRQGRRPRRGSAARSLQTAAGYENVDQRLLEARQKKQLKRRVRGEDYEQVTIIMDRELFVALDACLDELSARGGGQAKLSRSIFVRALLKRFLADADSKHKALDFGGLFTPDPRSAEELAVIEAALVERLKA